jgi:hypothetical protein
METPLRRSRPGKSIPAALATTFHFALQDGTIRTFERPFIEQMSPLDPMRLGLVASDRKVQEALEVVAFAHARWLRTLKAAASSPEAAAAQVGALRAQSGAYEVLERAVLEAEARRRRMLAVMPPNHAAMAAAAGLRLDFDTRLALETVLHRRPAAKDVALWQTPDAGVVGYLVAALKREVGRIQARREEGEVATERDVAVFDLVQARPRNRQRAPEWWVALLEEWNAAHRDSPFRAVRAFQDAFRRGRRGTVEQLYAEAQGVTALEQRAADHQAASETLEELVAAARLTPAMGATLAALRNCEAAPRWAHQDLVDRLRKTAAAKKV